MPESDVWKSQKRSPVALPLLAELRSNKPLRKLFFLGLVLALTDMSAYRSWGAIGSLPWLPLVFMILVGLGTGNFSGFGPIFSELFPTRIRSSAMGTAFNLSRGAQFFTPLIITWVTTLPLARGHGLGAGISIGAFFALFTGAWVWTLPETKGTEIKD